MSRAGDGRRGRRHTGAARHPQGLRADGLPFTPDWFFTSALMSADNVVRYLDAGMPPDTPNPSTGDTCSWRRWGAT